MAASVPGIGGLTPYWRKHLDTTIADLGRHLVVDLRSTDYLATPPVHPANTLYFNNCGMAIARVKVASAR